MASKCEVCGAGGPSPCTTCGGAALDGARALRVEVERVIRERDEAPAKIAAFVRTAWQRLAISKPHSSVIADEIERGLWAATKKGDGYGG